MATFKEVDRLERETLLAYIERELKLIKIAGMTHGQWLDYVFQRVYPEYFKPPTKPASPAGVYRAAPAKVSPLRKLPYETKRNLQPGEPGYEQQQRQLERLWLAERRRNGYIEY